MNLSLIKPLLGAGVVLLAVALIYQRGAHDTQLKWDAEKAERRANAAEQSAISTGVVIAAERNYVEIENSIAGRVPADRIERLCNDVRTVSTAAGDPGPPADHRADAVDRRADQLRAERDAARQRVDQLRTQLSAASRNIARLKQIKVIACSTPGMTEPGACDAP